MTCSGVHDEASMSGSTVGFSSCYVLLCTDEHMLSMGISSAPLTAMQMCCLCAGLHMMCSYAM